MTDLGRYPTMMTYIRDLNDDLDEPDVTENIDNNDEGAGPSSSCK